MTEFQRNQIAAAERRALNDASLQREEDKAKADRAAKKAASILQRDEEERTAKLKEIQLNNEALMSRLQTGTNASYNNEKAREAAAAKKPTVKVVTKDKDGNQTIRSLTPAQHAAELKAQNAPEVARIQAELDNHAREIAGGDKRYGLFNLFSRDNKVADLKQQMAALQPPPVDALSVDPVAAAAAAVAPGSIQSGVASGFNGTTSLSGRDFAPVKSSGFIGKPGGPNLFRDHWEEQLNPTIGDLRMAESGQVPAQEYPDPVAAAQAAAPASVAYSNPPPDESILKGRPATVNLEDPSVGEPVTSKIVIQNGNRFKVNPDGSAEHLGPVAK